MTATVRLRLAAATVIALGAAASHPATASATETRRGDCTGGDWTVAMNSIWNACSGMGYCSATLDSCADDGNGNISWGGTCYSC